MIPGMRIVPHAHIRPMHCAMWPQLGAQHRKGYFDVGTDDPEAWNHSYVSVEFVEQAATHLGWTSPDMTRQYEDTVAELERNVKNLEAELDEADKFAQAAEYTLNHFGSKVRQKPGRKVQQEAA